jgi:hypothetical protein
MVTLPGDVCMEQSRQRDVNDLPDDIYTIPDMMDVCQVQNSEGEKQVSGKLQKKGEKRNGGQFLWKRDPLHFKEMGELC